jgi:hypothetical protein
VTFFLEVLPMRTTQSLGLRIRVLQSGTTSVIFFRVADLLSVPPLRRTSHLHCTQDDVRAHTSWMVAAVAMRLARHRHPKLRDPRAALSHPILAPDTAVCACIGSICSHRRVCVCAVCRDTCTRARSILPWHKAHHNTHSRGCAPSHTQAYYPRLLPFTHSCCLCTRYKPCLSTRRKP